MIMKIALPVVGAGMLAGDRKSGEVRVIELAG
jgi:hypothetical protein